MTIKDLDKGLQSDIPQEDVLQSLSAVEKELVKKLKRVEIRGKFNRKVPILLTNSMLKKISRIRELRNKLKIDSVYLFAREGSEKPYRGSDVLKRLAREAEVENVDIFTWTSLRKQIATMSQALEITENDQDMLAGFLGHDIRVHRDTYRLPISVLEKSKVAALLLKINEKDTTDSLEADSFDEDNEKSGDNEGDVTLSASTSSSYMDFNEVRTCGKKKMSNKSAMQNLDKGVIKKPWSDAEMSAIHMHFDHFIQLLKVPKKIEIDQIVAIEDRLKHRKWKNIKDCIYNVIKKNKKNVQ